VLVEIFIRKRLRWEAHTVAKVEEIYQGVWEHIDGPGKRLLRCRVCRQRCREVHDIRTQLAAGTTVQLLIRGAAFNHDYLGLSTVNGNRYSYGRASPLEVLQHSLSI
jgi:hypothetical protein